MKTTIQGKLNGDSGWTDIDDDVTLAELEVRYRDAFFKTAYQDGVLQIINPVGNAVECEYREVTA